MFVKLFKLIIIITCIAIIMDYFFCILVIFSTKNRLQLYMSQFLDLLFRYKFDFFFITLAILFFFYKLYVPFIYSVTTVVYYKFLNHLFPTWDEKKLLLEHSKIDKINYDEIEWSNSQLFVILLLIIVSVVFNATMAKFYLAVLLLVGFIRFSGFKISKYFSFIVKKIKQINKDLLTLKYHWYKDFKFFRDVSYISLISLGISLFIATTLPLLFINIPADILKFNFNLWCVALLVHCLFSLLIDLYIIFFANVPVDAKTVAACQRCATLIGGALYSNYQLADNGFINPNAPYNILRDCQQLPRLIDRNQQKEFLTMKKLLPDVPESAYTVPTLGVKNSVTVSTPSIHRIALENADRLKEYATADELKILRIKYIPKLK